MTEVKYKDHPDYSTGYFDGLNDRTYAGNSDPYREGFRNGTWAREQFEATGFKRSGDGSFGLTMRLK
jgi:hypothetical protein